MKARRAFGLLVMAFGFLVITGVVSLSTASLKTELWKVGKTVYPVCGAINFPYMKAYRCEADWSIDYSFMALPMPAADDSLTAGYYLKSTLSSYLPVTAVYVGEEEGYWRYQVLFEEGGGTEWPSGSGGIDNTTDAGEDATLFGFPFSTVLGVGLVFAGWLVYRKR
jgi:hypothetical protein